MTDQLLQQIERFSGQLDRMQRAFAQDGISPSERRRLAAVRGKIQELRQLAAARADSAGGVDIDADVRRARALQGHFEAADDAGERARIARGLIALHRQIEVQLVSAPIGADGLPTLTGNVRWGRGSTTLEGIDPFGHIDVWRTALASGSEPVRVQDRRLQRRIAVSSDFGRFRRDVIAWLDRQLADGRAQTLVDASNLETVHRELGIAGERTFQIVVTADLRAAAHGRSYASVSFSAEPPPVDTDELDEVDVDPRHGNLLGHIEGDRVDVPAEDYDLESALGTAFEGVGQGVGAYALYSGAALAELGALGLGAASVAATVVVGGLQATAEVEASLASLAREVAVRAAARLARENERGYDRSTVTYDQLVGLAMSMERMAERVAWATMNSSERERFFGRLRREALTRMARVLTEQLGRVEGAYRTALEEKARELGATGARARSAVDAAYRRGVSVQRARFLDQFARAARSRL